MQKNSLGDTAWCRIILYHSHPLNNFSRSTIKNVMRGIFYRITDHQKQRKDFRRVECHQTKRIFDFYAWTNLTAKKSMDYRAIWTIENGSKVPKHKHPSVQWYSFSCEKKRLNRPTNDNRKWRNKQRHYSNHCQGQPSARSNATPFGVHRTVDENSIQNHISRHFYEGFSEMLFEAKVEQIIVGTETGEAPTGRLLQNIAWKSQARRHSRLSSSIRKDFHCEQMRSKTTHSTLFSCPSKTFPACWRTRSCFARETRRVFASIGTGIHRWCSAGSIIVQRLVEGREYASSFLHH